MLVVLPVIFPPDVQQLTQSSRRSAVASSFLTALALLYIAQVLNASFLSNFLRDAFSVATRGLISLHSDHHQAS